ncbi:uncharacterized protein [Trachinotus anak]|uniref:uncharacterized protein n=1 Tax=Trachinotus anak TaxID=443729 RepID=UPI0039F1BA9D
MDPSPVSGMKMKTPLVGVILGLLAVVHTTPINSVTQIPNKAEDVVFREAMTEGFLIENPFQPSLTTDSPKRNTTTQASQQLFLDTEGSAFGDGSEFFQHGGDHYATTTRSVSQAPGSSTVLSRDTDDSSSDASITQSPQSDFTSSSEPNEAQSSVTPDHIAVSQTTDPAVSSFDFLNTQSSDIESGNGEVQGQYPAPGSTMTSSSDTDSDASSTSTDDLFEQFAESEGSGFTGETSTESPTSTDDLFEQFAESEGSGFTGETSTASSTSTPDLIRRVVPTLSPEVEGSGLTEETSTASSSSTPGLIEHVNLSKSEGNNLASPRVIADLLVEGANTPSPQHKGHNTPGWIIIVAFIAGVAALVMVCVAIATREKWNGPNQVSQPEKKTGSSNQQRELEMETFLHKEEPRENGKAAEYTVIPLDELPENYSSH